MWVAPPLGTRTAELLEAPIMLAIGVLALALMLTFEFTVVLWLRGWTLAEYYESRDPVSGTVYEIMLGVFAIMPLLAARWLKRGSDPT